MRTEGQNCTIEEVKHRHIFLNSHKHSPPLSLSCAPNIGLKEGNGYEVTCGNVVNKCKVGMLS